MTGMRDLSLKRTDGTPLKKREITLMDDSEMAVTLQIFEDRIDEVDYEENLASIFKNVKVTEYAGNYSNINLEKCTLAFSMFHS